MHKEEKLVGSGLLDLWDKHEGGADHDDYTTHEYTITEDEYGWLTVHTAHTAVGWYNPAATFATMEEAVAFLWHNWDNVIEAEIVE